VSFDPNISINWSVYLSTTGVSGSTGKKYLLFITGLP